MNFASTPHSRWFYLNLIFWIGFTSLVYEIYSVKVLFLFFTESTTAVTLALSSFLAGLAASSLLFSQMARGQRDNSRLLLIMQMAVAAYGYLVLTHYELIPHLLDTLAAEIGPGWAFSAAKGAIVWLYLFVPAFFIGGAFPLVNGLYLARLDATTRDTGIVYFWDTLGSIAGVFCAGLWWLPQFGFRATAVGAVIINLLVVVALLRSTRNRLLILLMLLVLIGIELWPHNPSPNTVPAATSPAGSPPVKREQSAPLAPEYRHLDDRFGKILFQEMSPFGKVTVGTNVLGIPGNKGLFINYRDMCLSIEHESESVLGTEAVRNLPNNARILNIGLGCGYTAHSIVSARNVGHVDIVEINPVVAQAARSLFAEENGRVLESPKTKLIVEDGASYVRTTLNRYDAVVIDIEEVSVIYSNPLYSREYLEMVKGRLRKGGVLALWAQTGTLEFEKAVYNTLQAVFPHVSVRIVSDMYMFFASEAPLNIVAGSSEEQAMISRLLATPVDEVNTLDNRVLEKYFSIHDFFDLPDDYRERSVR